MRSLRVYIAIASVLLVLYLLAQVNRPKPIDWTETLSNNDKIPYGTYILYDRLNDIFPGAQVNPFREPVYNVLNDEGIKKAAYIIISNEVNLNEYDYSSLIKFIKSGNDVFIAASNFHNWPGKNLPVETQSELTLTSTGFVNSKLDTPHVYRVDKGISQGYFSNIDTTKAIILGNNSLGHSNFIKYQIGNGALYLNANPLLFSNYSLLNKSGSTYASIALSHLKNDKMVLWDQFYTQGREGDENQMRLFLRHKELKWAFYMTFIGLIAFVLYDMKRRQRIIPVVEPLKNATMDFVTVVGQVYYEKRNNANIAHKKIMYLLSYLRDKYQLKTNNPNKEFTEKLSEKLGIDYEFASKLVNYMHYINAQAHVNDNELIELNKLIEQFYIQSR